MHHHERSCDGAGQRSEYVFELTSQYNLGGVMPLLRAAGVGVRHRRRWVFRDLELGAEPGEIVAVVGPPGSGRTTALLALAKRFRLTAGTVALAGRAALGHVPDVEQPEPVFTVAEHVRERLALLGRSAHEADDVIAGGLLGLDPALKGRELSPYERQLLGLILAQLERPQLIALDGLDDGLDVDEQEGLWAELARIAAGGVAVVVTARAVNEDRVTTIVRLGDPRSRSDKVAAEDTPDDRANGEEP
jgi:ABC-2 type transport system ATP-binding protein